MLYFAGMVAIAKEHEYYASPGPGLQDPFDDAVDVDISAANHTFDIVPKSLWVGGSGDLKFTTKRGTVITLVNVVGGSLLPIRPSMVYKVGTTCTDMVGLY